MTQPTYVLFHTGGRYEREAVRLRSSLVRFALPHEIHRLQDLGTWQANTSQTGAFVLSRRQMLRGPLVYLDADAFLWARPDWSVVPPGMDLAAHRRAGIELLNGTLWLEDTAGCMAALERYAALSAGGVANEQRMLDRAIRESGARLGLLPASHCYIHGIPGYAGVEPVIEHLQASREEPGRAGVLRDIRSQRVSMAEAVQ